MDKDTTTIVSMVLNVDTDEPIGFYINQEVEKWKISKGMIRNPTLHNLVITTLDAHSVYVVFMLS